jgi:hypothetical protein
MTVQKKKEEGYILVIHAFCRPEEDVLPYDSEKQN